MDSLAIVSSISGALSTVGAWLDIFTGREDRDSETVKTVLMALNQTKAHIADWEKGERNREREHTLVRLWTEAAVAISRHDKEFAKALQMKAEYWADPENWSDDQVRNAGIGIENVTNQARLLLGRKL